MTKRSSFGGGFKVPAFEVVKSVPLLTVSITSSLGLDVDMVGVISCISPCPHVEESLGGFFSLFLSTRGISSRLTSTVAPSNFSAPSFKTS